MCECVRVYQDVWKCMYVFVCMCVCVRVYHRQNYCLWPTDNAQIYSFRDVTNICNFLSSFNHLQLYF